MSRTAQRLASNTNGIDLHLSYQRKILRFLRTNICTISLASNFDTKVMVYQYYTDYDYDTFLWD